jgi:hypothetical protein
MRRSNLREQFPRTRSQRVGRSGECFFLVVMGHLAARNRRNARRPGGRIAHAQRRAGPGAVRHFAESPKRKKSSLVVRRGVSSDHGFRQSQRLMGIIELVGGAVFLLAILAGFIYSCRGSDDRAHEPYENRSVTADSMLLPGSGDSGGGC